MVFRALSSFFMASANNGKTPFNTSETPVNDYYNSDESRHSFFIASYSKFFTTNHEKAQ